MTYYQPNQINPELLKGLEIAESAEQNVPVTTAPPAPTNGYVVDKSLVPQEKLPTMNEIYTARYADERQRDFKNNFPYPSLSPSEFAARDQVHTLKTAWQQAQEGIDALDPAKDAATISKLRQVQKDSADAANIIRNTAQTMGWNMKGMGADDSLAVSTQLLNLDRMRGMAELYDMPTAAAQKRESYEQMVQRGIAPHKARAVAERMGDEFREQNISRLIEGIGAYGSNGDGSLNEFGQMLAGKLYTEAPYQYGNIVNSFASPKELFNVNANMAQAAMQNQSAWDRAKLNAQNARDIAQLREQGDNSRLNFKEQNANNRHQAELQVKISEAYQKSPYGKYQAFMDIGRDIYGDDNAKVMEFVLDHMGGNSNARGTGAKQSKSAGTMNGYKAIISAIANGNDDDALEMFQSLRKQKADNVGKFYDGWSQEETAIDSEYDKALAAYFRTEYEGASEEEIKAKQDTAKQLLFDSVMVIGTGNTVKDLQEARQNARHHAKDKMPENDTTNVNQANQNIRNLLYPNNGSGGDF